MSSSIDPPRIDQRRAALAIEEFLTAVGAPLHDDSELAQTGARVAQAFAEDCRDLTVFRLGRPVNSYLNASPSNMPSVPFEGIDQLRDVAAYKLNGDHIRLMVGTDNAGTLEQNHEVHQLILEANYDEAQRKAESVIKNFAEGNHELTKPWRTCLNDAELRAAATRRAVPNGVSAGDRSGLGGRANRQCQAGQTCCRPSS